MKYQAPPVEIEPDLDPQRGQGLAEYALVLALVAIVAIAGLLILGGQIAATLSTVGSSIGV